MSQDHRATGPNGARIPYTCENQAFTTNVGKGHAHGTLSPTRGSVFANPLISAGGYSLWLEHVLEKTTHQKFYWLMWYDPKGIPTIPLSGVFTKDDLRQMMSQLADFVP
ncbi:MAG: hypothetical protein KKA28_17500 [Planctomycetes bacterium]|nr:hypothetical protein [Planctomycetota bacterium]MCG2685058.1 hypothetical protein [Planctomycetales bacterium]